jgi:hypothetical protein
VVGTVRQPARGPHARAGGLTEGALLDLNRAPALADGFKVAEDLHAVPVDVWIDEHVRRVRLAVPLFEVVLELWDVGRTGELDWTCLPSFRTAA